MCVHVCRGIVRVGVSVDGWVWVGVSSRHMKRVLFCKKHSSVHSCLICVCVCVFVCVCARAHVMC